MVDATVETEAQDSAGSRRKGLLIAALGAFLAGGAGFGVTYLGLVDGLLGGKGSVKSEDAPDYAFVPLDPLMMSLGPQAQARTLKFAAELEVEPGSEETVAALRPRILDVLNGYLRAVDESELEDPAYLYILRAQMLQRIQVVVGEGKVRDLLILEFILN
ncbi:flagellar basal body-associated FliL family protein [Halovulum sp. GXIMD14794]